jgi:hypothetical protein
MAGKEYDKTNSGVLYKNDRKEKPTHADWSGNGNWNGEEFYINAWIKESSKDGSKFFSFSFRPKVAKEDAAPVRRAAPAPARAQHLDDDIPF